MERYTGFDNVTRPLERPGGINTRKANPLPDNAHSKGQRSSGALVERSIIELVGDFDCPEHIVSSEDPVALEGMEGKLRLPESGSTLAVTESTVGRGHADECVALFALMRPGCP